MKNAYQIKNTLKNLRSNKIRAFLTILGIVIGTTSIILIMSIGEGARGLIVRELSGLGTDFIVLRPGKEPKGPTDLPETLYSDSIKQREIDAISKKSNAPGVKEVIPGVIVTGSVSYQGETYKAFTMGWSSEAMSNMYNVFPEEGSNFDKNDIASRAKVAVIGSKVKEELFGNKNPIGKKITIKNKKFKVVGYYPKKGQMAFVNIDDLVLIPYTTARVDIMGINHYHEVIIRLEDPLQSERTIADVKTTMRELHNISNPEDDDFFVVSPQGMLNQVQTILNILTVFLSSIIAISLVVGGIGIMNIMLVSVTERTREIGLRKSLGATNKDILIQFLLETITLTTLGGVISILLGAMLSFLIAIVLRHTLSPDWAFSFPISAVVLGLSVSTIVGLVFGIYPARQAARKSPIEALRYE